jgi:MoaA/NifB/PqqE/SkfB family radical SAM enzyme
VITDRIDSVTKIPGGYLTDRPPAPKSVKIELTGKCNYRCGFCALRMREESSGSINFELFKRLVGEMKEAGVEELGLFFLGESFTDSKLLIEACEYSKRYFPYVFLTTNGSLANPRLVHRLIVAGLDSLKFSINASDPEQFEEVMGVKKSLFWQSLNNLKQARGIRDFLRKEGYDCGLYASSIRYDGEQQKRMEDLLDKHVRPFVDEHYWLPLYSMGAFATQREEELGFKPIAGNQGRLGALRDPLPCWSAFTEGHITSKGKLSACCFDASGEWEMADLNKVSFMEGWNSEKFKTLRQAHIKKDVKNTVCEKCLAYR